MSVTATERRLSFVLDATVQQFGLVAGWKALIGSRRTKQLARARQCAMAVMHDALGLSTTEVGQLFDRDHSTVVYACKVVRHAPDYAQLFEAVKQAYPGEVSQRIPTGKGGLVDSISTDPRVMHNPCSSARSDT